MGATKTQRPAGKKEGAAPAVPEEKEGRAAKRRVNPMRCRPPPCRRARFRPVAFACAAPEASSTAASHTFGATMWHNSAATPRRPATALQAAPRCGAAAPARLVGPRQAG